MESGNFIENTMADIIVGRGQPAAVVFKAKSSTTQGRSLQSLLASLAVAGAIFFAEMFLFLILRIKFPSIYKNKTRAKADEKGHNSSKPETPDMHIIRACGLDAYLFLRYLQILLWIFVPSTIILLPVLIPVNLLGGRGRTQGVGGLDRLSWTNVAATQTVRYWVHLMLALGVISWTCRVIYLEMKYFTRLRHQHVVATTTDCGLFGKTVLVTDIPRDYLDEAKLRRLYEIYPGGVRAVTINRNFDQLSRHLRRRTDLVHALEQAETRLIQAVNYSNKFSDAKRPAVKKIGDGIVAIQPGVPLWRTYLEPQGLIRLPFGTRTLSMKRPQDIADKITSCHRALQELDREIQQSQANVESHQLLTSAFITFNDPGGAHMASQSNQYGVPHRMNVKHIEGSPDTVIWTHMSMTWEERLVRKLITTCLLIGLILISVLPVAFTGLLSQVDYLATVVPWLAWILTLPDWALAFLQGVLPPALLAVVMGIVPILLRLLILEQGIYTRTAAELSMQTYYFLFLFLQVFFVVSVSSSAAAFFSGLATDFKSVAALLAQNLPKASNYFFSYMLLQALSVSAATLLQTTRLLALGFGYMYDITPREKWERRKDVEISWGSFIPTYTNLAVIGLIYSVVSPVILVFNVFTFTLLLATQRYNMLNIAKGNLDTGGLIYPNALNHLFVGLYVMEAYLVGLFCLVRDEQGRPACIGQAVIMALATLITMFYQWMLNDAFQPLIQHLPQIRYQASKKTTETRNASPNAYLLRRIKQLGQGLENINTIGAMSEEETNALAAASSAEDKHARSLTEKFRHEVLSARSPVVWLPRDNLGVAEDEIRRSCTGGTAIAMSFENATLDDKAQVVLSGEPPDPQNQIS